MSAPTYVEMMVTHLFRVDVSYIDFYGNSFAGRPMVVNARHRGHGDYEDEVLAVQAKIPKLMEIVTNGGEFQLLEPSQSVKIYDICIGILDSWVETLRKGAYRGPIDLELLSGLDELAKYVYSNTLRYRPSTPDRVATMATQLGAFMGTLDRGEAVPEPDAVEAYKPYVSRLSHITTYGIRNGLIRA